MRHSTKTVKTTKVMRKPIAAMAALALLVLLLPWASSAQESADCESDYIVRAGDWLAKISDQYYGDSSLYPAIVLATSARAVLDDSYATVADPWLIEPGWKLCIPSAQMARAGLTVTALRNAEYQSEWTRSGRAPLTDGEYREAAAPGSATKTVIMLTDRMAFGYLREGQEAAIVILVTDPGGSGTFYSLAVVVEQNGELVNVAQILLGDRVKLNSVSLAGDEIVVDMLTQGPDDPFCCPTQHVVQKYALQEDQLVQTSSEVISQASSLEEALWKLDSYLNSQGDLVSVLPDTEVTAKFQEDQVTGTAGCNRYFGSYESIGDSLTVGVIGVTEMYCSPETLMAQEGEYLAALQNAASFRIMDGQLQVLNRDGEVVLTFSVLEPISLTGTTWRLTGYNNGKGGFVSLLTDTEITAVFDDDGRVAGSAGCNQYTASYSLEDDTIAFGPAAATRKMCSEPSGIMEQESAYLAALGSATIIHIEGDELLLTNADGVRIATFVA